ncbi:MAG: polysaccharide biosynthesis tyrosine autokinase [Mariprofundus sp.]|nr:polysaccharide biosynthesis tyrosine autokinase [Mariprofundus sp.]
MNMGQQHSITDTSELDISHYLSIFNRYKWSILTLAVLSALLVGLIVFSMTPMYKATTKLLIESNSPKMPTLEDLYGANGQNHEYFQTQFEIIQSRRIAGMVVDKLYPALKDRVLEKNTDPEPIAGMDWVTEMFPGSAIKTASVPLTAKQLKIQQLQYSLSLKPVMRTQIVGISFVSDDPNVAARTANAFAQAYIEDQLGSRIEMTRQGTEWLFERLNVLKASLQKSEKRQQRYMDSQKLMNVSGQGEGIGGATGRVVNARSAFAKIQKRYGFKHPKYIQAKSELAAAQQALASGKAEIRSISRKGVRLRELQRQVESDRQLYDIFLKRMKESSQAVDYKKANARILDAALVPKVPFKPNKQRFIILAFVGGLFLGLLLAFLTESLNKTIKSTEEVESKLGQSNLGMLPLMDMGKKGSNAAFQILDAKQTGFSEAIRTIRTGLVLSNLDNPHKIILVTSSVPGEGKTTVSTNLAAAMAKMDKTLLIGADLRRPSLTRACGLPDGAIGLSQVVAGEASFKDCIHLHEDTGLHILPGGMIPPNPLELLSSERFKKMLEVLEKSYDRIVIDSPPVQAVSDALVLSSYAKAVVYVVEADSTHEKVVRKGIQRLVEYNAPIAGIVLNKVDLKKAEKYGYEYGGYYDQYGYSAASEKA